MDPSTVDSAPLRVARALCRRRSAVLLYHGLGDPAPGTDPHNLQVRPQAFRAQLELLLAAGFELVTVAELAARIENGSPPPGLAALSFDDGMEDNHSVLAPILAEHGAPATIYVTTGAIGEPNPYMGEASGARMMNADEIRALAGAGFEIGAHSVSHPDMSALSRELCLAEMTESKTELERITGEPVRTFAYPFGHYGPAAIAAAKEAGFEAAATCVNRGSWAPYELKRTLITGRTEIRGFLARISGLYEPLVLGRAGSAARRATRRLRARG